ncbi:Mbeg1-like protein [Paenibacillus lutimineralis]|uniref:DUF2974 domain-containing protein n=1 Tax=Paenibacillus lutimineralis TaxID=2707005 RepID=A0A3Q9IC63_9BACL|nr:Mbeg1-like protein [Paenibacillus lutimineralis]AZS17558.1 DUF2974 domain-containing protein [Paenibacillus lutimineralis]
MSELSNSQLILLDNLIYLDDVANRNNKKVEDIVDYLLKGGLDKSITVKDGANSYPGLMTREEWITVLEAIKKDPQLMNLTLKHGDVGKVYDKNGNIIVDQNGKPLEVGARMATFVDSDKNATVVFRGTAGDFEWYDNGTGGYLSDTDMQKQALKYIESLPYNNITVTGHSKGGNKAQYVGILSDKVDRVLSLDGQGFSKEFVEKYQDLIDKNRYKIISISAESDYVNCLLIPVAGKFIYIDTEYQEDFLRNHSPVIVLDGNGQLRDTAEQGAIPQLVNDLTIYLNAHMPEPDRSYAMDGLLAMLQSGDEGFQKVSQDHTNQGIKIALPYVGDYLLEKAAQGGKDFGNLLAATIGMAVLPQEFMDDFLLYLKINADNFGYLRQLKEEIGAILGPIIREKLQAFVSDLAAKIENKAKEIAASISEFAGKIKDGWDAMVQMINNFMSDLKNAGMAALEKINQFKDRMFQGIKDFGNWVAEGTKKAADAVKNAWNSSIDTVKGWFGIVKEKTTNAIIGLKDGIKRTVDLTRSTWSKVVDASITKAKEIGNWLVTKLDQARDKMKVLGSKISAAFTAFVDKLKAGWESLKDQMKSLAEKAKDAAIQIYEGVARFAQTLSQTVKSFCNKLVSTYRRIMEGIKKSWDTLVDRVSNLYSNLKNTISLKVSEYKEKMKSMVTLSKSKLKDLGQQAYGGIKPFTRKVVTGLSKFSGGLLMVSVDRLSDLQTRFKRMDDEIVSTTGRIMSDAERIASDISRAYSESNVQSQIRQLQRAIDDVRNRGRRIATEMQRKTHSITVARDQYLKVEQMVRSEIRGLI